MARSGHIYSTNTHTFSSSLKFLRDNMHACIFQDSASSLTLCPANNGISKDTVHVTLRAYVDVFLRTANDSYSKSLTKKTVVIISRCAPRAGFHRPHPARSRSRSSRPDASEGELVRVRLQLRRQDHAPRVSLADDWPWRWHSVTLPITKHARSVYVQLLYVNLLVPKIFLFFWKTRFQFRTFFFAMLCLTFFFRL